MSAIEVGTASERIAEVKTTRATSFGAWADEYDDWRPTYPDTAVDWLTPPVRAHVAEIGAGTGKLTDRLIERGLDLEVVEPDGRMLGILSQRHPTLRTHEAGATSLPLDDASVDAVLVADAWHWFPKDQAAAEVARVLRPNGWLGCVWNVCSTTTWTPSRSGRTLQRPQLVRTICGLKPNQAQSDRSIPRREMRPDLRFQLVGRVGLEPTTQGL